VKGTLGPGEVIEDEGWLVEGTLSAVEVVEEENRLKEGFFRLKGSHFE
jgi:hypothetical protein